MLKLIIINSRFVCLNIKYKKEGFYQKAQFKTLRIKLTLIVVTATLLYFRCNQPMKDTFIHVVNTVISTTGLFKIKS